MSKKVFCIFDGNDNYTGAITLKLNEEEYLPVKVVNGLIENQADGKKALESGIRNYGVSLFLEEESVIKKARKDSGVKSDAPVVSDNADDNKESEKDAPLTPEKWKEKLMKNVRDDLVEMAVKVMAAKEVEVDFSDAKAYTKSVLADIVITKSDPFSPVNPDADTNTPSADTPPADAETPPADAETPPADKVF